MRHFSAANGIATPLTWIKCLLNTVWMNEVLRKTFRASLVVKVLEIVIRRSQVRAPVLSLFGSCTTSFTSNVLRYNQASSWLCLISYPIIPYSVGCCHVYILTTRGNILLSKRGAMSPNLTVHCAFCGIFYNFVYLWPRYITYCNVNWQ